MNKLSNANAPRHKESNEIRRANNTSKSFEHIFMPLCIRMHLAPPFPDVKIQTQKIVVYRKLLVIILFLF